MIVYHGSTMEVRKPEISYAKRNLEIYYYKNNNQIAFITQAILDDVVIFQKSYEVVK